MHRLFTPLSSGLVVAWAFATLGALATAGCSSSSTPANPSDGEVSFANDVMPIFQTGCTVSGECHGQPNNAGEENLYLGDNETNTQAIIAQVYAQLVGIKSMEDPAMNLVTAKDVANSYLWHKLAGDQATFTSDCAKGMCGAPTCLGTPCGTLMPYLGNALDPASLDKINHWIAQGAANN
jgi:hypothetical protein